MVNKPILLNDMICYVHLRESIPLALECELCGSHSANFIAKKKKTKQKQLIRT